MLTRMVPVLTPASVMVHRCVATRSAALTTMDWPEGAVTAPFPSAAGFVISKSTFEFGRLLKMIWLPEPLAPNWFRKEFAIEFTVEFTPAVAMWFVAPTDSDQIWFS